MRPIGKGRCPDGSRRKRSCSHERREKAPSGRTLRVEAKSAYAQPLDLYRAEGIAAALVEAVSVGDEGATPLGVVQIRECLEGEPVGVALERIRWAMGCTRPYRALRTWAREESRGLYKAKHRQDPNLKDRKAFLRYAARKETALGRELSRKEVERLASRFYSPARIAELSEISEHVWRSYEETYEVAGGYAGEASSSERHGEDQEAAA